MLPMHSCRPVVMSKTRRQLRIKSSRSQMNRKSPQSTPQPFQIRHLDRAPFPRPPRLYKPFDLLSLFPISCARACTVASEVFTEAQSFADCKLHIRTRLLALAFSNFWKPLRLLMEFCTFLWSSGMMYLVVYRRASFWCSGDVA